MSSDKSPILVVFVPGIMGSSLYLKKAKQEVWGENIGITIHSLRKHPEKLNANDTYAGEVIRSMNFLNTVEIQEVYAPLIDFCRNNLGLRVGDQFNAFAYNWLVDNTLTAKALAEDIKRLDDKNNYRLCLIAHSMGGIVSRLMLLENPEIAERTKLFFQIATPVTGAAKAYDAIKRSRFLLLFEPHFDKFRLLLEEALRGDVQRLKKTLERCHSLYQLLPPQDVISLYDVYGTGYSALDPMVWAEGLREYFEKAQQVHDKLKSQALSINIKCIYSDHDKTPIHYLVKAPTDPQKFEVIQQMPSLILGDNTVTCASAIAYSEEPELVHNPPADHLGLCHNPEVHARLKTEFGKLL
jgi:pimeloyl-ACP methyl ester carboxylesterase